MKNIKILILFLAILVIATFLINNYVRTRPSQAVCGDNVCEKGENIQNCPEDCKDIQSIFGIGYARPVPQIAEIYSQTGIRLAKIPGVDWQHIEPAPPINGVHKYKWNVLDKIVKNYQENGFHLQMVLHATSPWASKPLEITPRAGTMAENIAAAPPKEEYWDDYGEFIKALVERYDNDGIDDMPGLRFPVLYYEIESEAQMPVHWQGTVEEYIRLLSVANRSAKQANPNSKIILSGINLGDIFDDMPDEATVKARFDSLPPSHKPAIDFIKKTLKEKDYYDIIEFHYNRDYLGIYGTVQWIRQYSDKPIWAGDTTSAPWLFNTFVKPYPNPQELFESIKNGRQPETDWYRKEQSSLTAKKFIVAAEVGLERVIMETMMVWSVTGRSPVAVDYMWDLQSMIDKNKNPYPVFYTLKLLVEKIDGYDEVQKIDIGKGLFAYEFKVKGRPVYVFWYEDGIPQGPNDQAGSKTVDLSKIIGSKTVRVTHLITQPKQTQPKTEIMPANSIKINETPIFIEEL